MDRRSFHRLCQVLVTRGHLRATRNVSIEEMVAFFLYILAHHLKNRTINHHFRRSGRTIKLLGALDGTPVKVHVPECDKPKYGTRKNEIATNVLGVCTPDMQFIYVLPGWEGSAHDGRVRRDAVTRRNGLKVPNGCYYLVDGGYTNGKGFLAPYRRTRYHLNEWRDGYRPTTPAEFFNMKHSSARNVIERCFGLLKMRWGILRSPSYYHIKTYRRIISVCCMLHNFIKREMVVDPIEADADGQFQDGNSDANNYITTVESSDE
nr:protein ALP1-like [Malus domestica]